eukprot:2627051-Pyramimonas_sp.AAC.1
MVKKCPGGCVTQQRRGRRRTGLACSRAPSLLVRFVDRPLQKLPGNTNCSTRKSDGEKKNKTL